jgi:hypothetical protein
MPRKKQHGNCKALTVSLLVAAGIATVSPVDASDADVVALEERIAKLQRELAEARKQLDTAKQKEAVATTVPEADKPSATEEPEPPAEEAVVVAVEPSDKIQFGPLTIGGAMRVNYVIGSYETTGDGPQRGGNGGNFELDTFRINMDLDYEQWIGKLEYRWYDGYNFLHTGWLGYEFDDASQVQVGLTRVPFGPGPYGVSQSWFFDQHYYVGLSDDMDLGIKYSTSRGNWDLDLAYFASSEWNGNGISEDSARYSYDAVKWTESIDPDGTVNFGGAVNGYEEKNQLNLRAIYHLGDSLVPTDIGASLQWGQLDGTGVGDGDHWAASAHMINQFGNLKLASQLTRYEINVDSNNPWGTDALIPMGAYDFAWPVATKAWIPAVSLSYKYETPTIGWLDYVLPYAEYSTIIKDESDFNDSQMVTLGAAWARGNWYIYSDLVFSDGNYFIGNEGDDYSNIYHGVGDFGVTGNNKWNHRFNINFGYYF